MQEYWKIDRKLLERVAKVARLNLKEEEKEKFVKQLANILQSFKEIDKVDTTKVRPSFHPIEMKNVWREDEAKKWEWNPLENTKLKEKKYFKGPRII